MSVEQLRKYRYAAAAVLNDEGMNLFPGLFPDNLVPIRVETMISRATELDGLEGEHQVHIINFWSLTPQTQNKLVDALAGKFDVDPEEIRKDAEENGIPLRHSLVSHIAMDPRFFL